MRPSSGGESCGLPEETLTRASMKAPPSPITGSRSGPSKRRWKPCATERLGISIDPARYQGEPGDGATMMPPPTMVRRPSFASAYRQSSRLAPSGTAACSSPSPGKLLTPLSATLTGDWRLPRDPRESDNDAIRSIDGTVFSEGELGFIVAEPCRAVLVLTIDEGDFESEAETIQGAGDDAKCQVGPACQALGDSRSPDATELREIGLADASLFHGLGDVLSDITDQALFSDHLLVVGTLIPDGHHCTTLRSTSEPA